MLKNPNPVYSFFISELKLFKQLTYDNERISKFWDGLCKYHETHDYQLSPDEVP